MRALALEHLRPNPIGVFGDVLEERGIAVDRIMLDEGEPLPDWRRYDLIVAMGAAANVWDEDQHPWLRGEKGIIREALLAGVPYFGVCFGAQLLAAALGARSYRGAEPELGTNPIFLTAAARRDPVFRGFPPGIEVLEWHTNHFDLPPGAVRLARSPRYENQAIRYGRVAFGIQCHLEPSLDDIRLWFELFPALSETFEATHGDGAIAAFSEEYATFVPLLRETARQLFGRWVENALALGGLPATRRAVARNRAHMPADRLLGRDAELARIDAALTAGRQGGSAVLVLRGEAGVGKSALLDYAIASAQGLRPLRTAGRDTEIEVPLEGLAELCRPLRDAVTALAPERREPLAAALGVDGTAGPADRFAAYAAALDLITAVAEQTPVLIAVDDAHWLDDASAEAIRFIASRLHADGIALLVATETEDDIRGAEELRLGGLDPQSSRSLLEAQFGDQLAPVVADSVLDAARGNPLALLEIPVGLTPAQRRGEDPIDERLPESAEWAFLRRIAGLPADARRALLVCALAASDELEAIERACTILGTDASALAAAEQAGLVRRSGGRLSFRHGLVRATMAYSALRADRRAAHAALAETATPLSRLWHLAHAAAGPDEGVAAGLEQAGRDARGQRAYATAARTLEMAARVTPDDEARAQRLVLAAESARQAGHVNAALDHLDAARRRAVSRDLRAEIDHLAGRIAARSGSAERARDVLAGAAARCERENPAKAGAMLADAVLPALRAGSPRDAALLARRAVRLVGDHAGPGEIAATLTLGTALLFAGDYADGAEHLDRAADLATDAQSVPDGLLRAYLGAGLAAAGRHERARGLLTTVVEEARWGGAVGVLPFALVRLAGVDLETGHWANARGALHEALELALETGQSADYGLASGTLAWLDAAQGRPDECHEHAEVALALAGRLGAGSRLDRAAAALGLLELSLGRPAAAIPHLEAILRLESGWGWSDAARTPHRSPDLVEAYALVGRREDAQATLEAFSSDAQRSERASAMAAVIRCRALLGTEDEIDARFSEALAVDTDVTGPFERARTELLYGRRLSAARRTDEAREHVLTAFAMFERLGAQPWAHQAGEQIAAAGGAAPEPGRDLLERLTPLELEVALVAADGVAAREAAARLFLGPRSAQLHLASALAKLQLDDPGQLRGVIGAERSSVAL